MVMRRFDVWVGRIAAIVGIVYVLLASLWPLSASADEAGTYPAALSIGDRDEPTIGMLPTPSMLVDIRIARVIAEVVAGRDRDAGSRRKRARGPSLACPPASAVDVGDCDATSSASSLPDASTTAVLVIPIAVLTLAAASTVRGRGSRMA